LAFILIKTYINNKTNILVMAKRGVRRGRSSKKSKVSKKIVSHKKSSKKKKNGNHLKHKKHPLFRQELTLGQRASDGIAKFGGSWTFIIIFLSFLIGWIIINTAILIKKPYDPYRYILLNLVLSVLAAIQAPIILMTQNRQAEVDRLDAKYDHAINRKAEREIQAIQKDLNGIRMILRNKILK